MSSNGTQCSKIYLFQMRNNEKKMAYGKTPEDALEILALRLTVEEMEQIVPENYRRIKRSELLTVVEQLG